MANLKLYGAENVQWPATPQRVIRIHFILYSDKEDFGGKAGDGEVSGGDKAEMVDRPRRRQKPARLFN